MVWSLTVGFISGFVFGPSTTLYQALGKTLKQPEPATQSQINVHASQLWIETVKTPGLPKHYMSDVRQLAYLHAQTFPWNP